MPFLGFLAGGCDVEESPHTTEQVQEEKVGKRVRAKDVLGRHHGQERGARQHMEGVANGDVLEKAA